MDVKKLAEIYDSLGKSYLDSIAHVSPQQIQDFARLVPRGGSILDVGCAGGRDSKKFADLGLVVTGIDISGVFLAEARKEVPQAAFRKMDLRALEFPRESFDAIWCHAILHHIAKSDIPAALEGLRDVLKSGGFLHASVKEGEGSHSVGEVLTAGRARPHIFFRMEELEKFVADAGFAVMKSMYLPDMLSRADVRWICVWARA